MLFFIPAKYHSDRVPFKNSREFAGSNLWMITAKLCFSAGITPIVSSESENLLSEAQSIGCQVHLRKLASASKSARIEEVLISFIEDQNIPKSQSITLLQPTSPLRSRDSLINFSENWKKNSVQSNFEASLSVTSDFGEYWMAKPNESIRIRNAIPELGTSRTSTLRNPLLRENGLFYATKVDNLMKGHSFADGRINLFETPAEEDGDIDTLEDFLRIENFYKQRNKLTN